MRVRPVLAVLLAALAAAGCGVGPGEATPEEVTLVVTRDFGQDELTRKQFGSVRENETVMRLLQRETAVETRYGGGFVQSIDQLAGGTEAGRPVDWFYYVNGVEADVGAASKRVHGGDRVWWDRRDWGTAMAVPAVIGSFPEPFRSGVDGERRPVRVDCARGFDRLCDEVTERMRAAGVRGIAKAGLGASSGIEILRVIVGPWELARRDPTASLLEGGPKESGVFARPSPDGSRIDLLDPTGKLARSVGAGSGLVAAIRFSEQQPTWFVTGTDEAGVAAAAAALEEGVLQNRFAMAVVEGRGVPLPIIPEGSKAP